MHISTPLKLIGAVMSLCGLFIGSDTAVGYFPALAAHRSALLIVSVFACGILVAVIGMLMAGPSPD